MKSTDTSCVTYVVNPYNEYAIEEALQTKEAAGEGEVIVLSVGGESNNETIRKALAMGADNAVLLKTENELDSLSVAKALSEEIKSAGAELVFVGKQSVDYDNQIVGQLTAELLGFNCVSVVVDFSLEGDEITVEREIEGGREVVKTSLPAVITAQKGLNEPRYASLKGIMTAKRKTIEVKELTIDGLSVETVSMQKPVPKQPGKIVGEDAGAVPELVRLLKEEAKVI